jgi:thiosulfate/3-mercaptopyruvate sulfurtransferase
MTVLISAADLRGLLANAEPPRVLDVRWSLDQPNGLPAYLAGHIPGAAYASLEDELSLKGDPTDGRHPLPTREGLQAAARAWGLNSGDAAVVYDAGPGFVAARAWWLLRHAGVADVRILDGGLAAWVEEGGPVTVGQETPPFGDIELDWGHMDVVGLDDVEAFAGSLLDARAPERYRGEIEPIDPQAGHIPGAINVPTAGNVGPDGRFLGREELKARFANANDGRPVAVYCGSGVTAAHQIAALEVAGIRAALYPGSWSQWSTLGLPVAVGEARG